MVKKENPKIRNPIILYLRDNISSHISSYLNYFRVEFSQKASYYIIVRGDHKVKSGQIRPFGAFGHTSPCPTFFAGPYGVFIRIATSDMVGWNKAAASTACFV